MSCLFHSLSAFIQGTDAAALRHILADYMEKNPILYDNEKISDIGLSDIFVFLVFCFWV